MELFDNQVAKLEKIYKNTGLFISIIGGIGSFAFPIYAILTQQALLIPILCCATLLIISIIASLFSYYEEKLKEIKNSHEYKLNEKLADGSMTPSQYQQRYAILVEKGVIESKTPKKS